MRGLTQLQEMLFKHQLETKLFHFQTNSYAAHKTSDVYLTNLWDNSDKFMETLRGHMSEKKSHIDKVELSVESPTDKNFVDKLTEFVDFMQALDLPSDVSNIRDDMVGEAMQLIYLLQFK